MLRRQTILSDRRLGNVRVMLGLGLGLVLRLGLVKSVRPKQHLDAKLRWKGWF